MLRKSRGFTLVAVLSLALGIGATTAMFSLIYAVLLHPFPYAGADRIMNPVIIDNQHPDQPLWFPLSQAQFDDLRLAAPVDSPLGFNNSNMEITGGALPEDISGIYLTENAGSFFGVRPLFGRNIEPYDAENGGHSVVVLNYRFWQRHFGGDPDIIGRTLEINHAPYTIIGVMPRSFAFNDTTGVGDVYLPGSLMRGIVNVPYLAYIPWIKLRPHVTLAAANAALEPIVRQFADQHPDRFPHHWHLALQPIIVPYQQETGRTLTLLLAGVVLLLIMPNYVQFRTQGDPLTYLHSIRAAVASVATDQQISNGTFNGTFTLSEALERDAQYSRQRLFSILFGVFAAMALALVGIFSVVAYSVAQRTTEFGVRLALGAPCAHVLWVAARIALVSSAAGIVIGLAFDSFLCTVLAHWMQSGFATGCLLAAAALLALSALLACLLPARRAMRIDPMVAWRSE